MRKPNAFSFLFYPNFFDKYMITYFSNHVKFRFKLDTLQIILLNYFMSDF